MFLGRKTNVLIPQRILKLKGSLSQKQFYALVREYIQRYKNYHLREVVGNFAVCDCHDDIPKQLNQKRRKTHE